MAVAGDASSKRDWKKRESFGSALLQIGIVAALLFGAVFFVYKRNERKQKVGEGMDEVKKSLAVRDNPADIQKALKRLDEVFEIDPNAPDALAMAADLHTQLWLVHRVAGADSKAKEFLAKAEAADSKSDERYATRAFHLLAAGQTKEADEYIDGLRRQGASSPKLWHAQAAAKQKIGQLALAREAYKQAADKAWKNPRFTSSFAEELIDEANYWMASGEITKALGSNPEHVRARLLKGIVALYKKDGVAANEAVSTIKELETTDLTPGMKALLLSTKAELAFYEQKYDEAIRLATEATTLNPDEHFAHFAKAKAMAQKKDPAAVDAFKAAIALRPTAPLLYVEGASQLQQAGNMDPALALLDAYENLFKNVMVTSMDGKSVSALERDDRYYISRGDVLKAAGKKEDALASYEKAIAAKSVMQAKAWYAKGLLQLESKDLDKAKESLMVITPDDGSGTLPEAYVAMGDLLFQQKDYAAGCQNYGFALTRFRAMQAPREKLNTILDDVEKRLVTANQKPMAKAWKEEGKALIQ